MFTVLLFFMVSQMRVHDKKGDCWRMESLKKFFEYMHDIDFPYVVLRNWENLPDSVEMGEHSDLDLLVYDFEHWKEVFPQAIQQHEYPRVRFRLPIGENYIYCDVRHLGDDYYPYDFERAILEEREWNPAGFFTPNATHHTLALAYHATHHKGFNSYKKWLGDVSVDELLVALKKSSIGWVKPKDPSVGDFNPYWKGATAIVKKDGEKIVKKQVGWMFYKLEENEYRVLTQISGKHFPVIIDRTEEGIAIEDCGDMLTEKNLPSDWKKQLVEIVQDLKANHVQHRDIKPDNLMVKNGLIKLIDFGWAKFYSDPEDNPPSCLGFPYKPSWGHDDNFSMKKVIKEIEYKLEEA